MNELFAADPAVCCSASDLKLLLASFGPYAGRYLANYPTHWATHVETRLNSVGDVEATRVKTLLRRARESIALITRANLPWNAEQDWISNARPFVETKPVIFNGLVASEANPPNVHELHDLDLPPTADECLEGTASEYVRASKILLLLSPEVVLVDPFLSPTKRYCLPVLQAIFEVVAKGKCQKVTLWARAAAVFGTGDQSIIKSDIQTRLRQLTQQTGFRSGRVIEMVLVEDESSQRKMHGRYLLSIKGGIRFDQGFQSLPAGRLVDVGPIGKSTHDALLDVYFDGKHDMKIVGRIGVKV